MKSRKIKSSSWRTGFDLEKKEKRKKELEEKMKEVGFWEDKEKAGQAKKELAQIKEGIEVIRELKEELAEIEELVKIAKTDEELQKELGEKIENFGEKVKKQSFKIYLFGEYDSGNALLEIMAGAGGRDAQDWAAMLLRMYERYCQKQGFRVKILGQSFGEAGGPEGRIGIKHATLEIKGKHAFGLLKKERGVHRLVRISPFSPKKLRHTSFALVEIWPEIPKVKQGEMKIEPQDLRVETFRASGPGGQYVNKRETAVRITHLPTKITVSCQSERSQAQNRNKATLVLYAKLLRLKEQERKEKISELKGDAVSVSWGNQIRSYVLHPYKMVKDLRTGVETGGAEKVLDGDLDEFVEAEMKI